MSVETLAPDQFTEIYLRQRQLFTPSDITDAQVGRVDMTTVTGASGSGKDTLILGTGLPKVVSDTDRPERENNGVMEVNGREYFFRRNNLGLLLAELAAGEFVQHTPGPNGRSFYGTRAAAYPDEGPALLDVVAAAIDDMRALPFNSVESVHITAQSYQAWRSRWGGRGETPPEETAKRMAEAESSLIACLGRDDLIFVVNDDPVEAAEVLGNIATHREWDSDKSTAAKNVAYAILQDLRADA